LANPNGTYSGGNHTVGSATRYNANNIDLNRNFPDPAVGDNPDGNAYQQETQFMMAFAEKHRFDLGMNIHGGAEVVNYPWDTWSKRSPDDVWWRYIGGNYRDSAQANSPIGYLTGVTNGLSNGYDWYRITGGRQDYMNYFHDTREFTLEISGIKLYPTENLPQLWNYNKAALLGYLHEATYGIQGLITDARGKSIHAKIEVLGYDADNSEVFSDSLNGFFVRYLKEGTYQLKISTDGYSDVKINSLKILDGKQTYFHQILIEPFSELCINTSPQTKVFYNAESDSISIPIINCGNQVQIISASFKNLEANSFASIKNNSFTLNPTEKKSVIIYPNNTKGADTTVNLSLTINSNLDHKIPIQCQFVNTNKLGFSNLKPNYTIFTHSEYTDSILITNSSTTSIQTIFSTPNSWISLNSDTLLIPAKDSICVEYQLNSMNIPVGIHPSKIFVNNKEYTLSFTLKVNAIPNIEIINYHQKTSVLKNNDLVQTFFVSNQGADSITYCVSITDSILNKESLISPLIGTLFSADTQFVSISIPTTQLQIGNYISTIEIITKTDTIYLPWNISIDTLPVLLVNTDTIYVACLTNKPYKDSILLKNIGGSLLKLSLYENSTFGNSILVLPNKTKPIPKNDSSYIPYATNSSITDVGIYYSWLNINGTNIPIKLHVKKPSELLIDKTSIVKNMTQNQTITDTIFISNSGDELLEIDIKQVNSSAWFKHNLNQTQISPYETIPIIFTIDTQTLSKGDYIEKLSIKGKSTVNIPIILKVEEEVDP